MPESRQVLIFRLLKEEYAIDITCVREVLRPCAIHPLPRSPVFVEGVINLRQHIITVIDLRKKFHFEITGNGENTRIIICRIKKFIIGLIVDSVSEVIAIPEKQIDPTPDVISTQKQGSYVLGVARISDRIITVLDPESILTKEETVSLSDVKKDK